MTGYFSVRNFDKFQHYKDRNPPWIRLYNSLLDSYEYACLPDASKAHLLAIFLLASRLNNKIPADVHWLKNAIHATESVDLNVLTAHDFIVMDHDCSETLAACEQSALPEKRRGRGETEEDTIVSSIHIREIEHDFEHWWRLYPEKIGKGAAKTEYIKARKKADATALSVALEAYIVNKPEDRQWAHPRTWLHQERWLDEPATGPPKPIDYSRGLTDWLNGHPQESDQCLIPMEALPSPT